MNVRFWSIGCFFVIFILALVGATKLEVSDDAAEAMLPTDPVSVARYDEFLSRFPSDQGALVVFENLLCSDEGWALIQSADEAFRRHPLIDRTVSLASPNSRYIEVQGDTVDLSRFADVAFESGEARCAAARDYRPFQRILVSEDGLATAMFLIAEGDSDATTFSQALLEIHGPIAEQAEDLGGRSLITGEAVMSAELSRVVAKDSQLIAGVVVLMTILVYFSTRTFTTTLTALGTSLFTMAFAYGAAGWLGIELTPNTSLVVFLLVPLSSAFVIHAHGYASRQEDQRVIPREAVAPCILAGVSTGIGFACTGLTPAPDVQALALLGACGIAAATVAMFLFVFPVLTSARNLKFALTFTVPRWPLLNPMPSLLLIVLLILLAAVGLSRLKIDYDPTNYLPLTNEARADFEEVGRYFGRMNTPYIVEVDEAESPERWVSAEQMVSAMYEAYPTGFQANWFYDHIAEVAGALSAEDTTAGYSPVFPDDPFYLSQVLLWFDPEDKEPFIDEDQTRFSVLFQLPFTGSHDYYEFKHKVESLASASDLPGYFTGRVASFFETGHRVGQDNLKGLGIAACAIFLVLLALFRSLPLALIGLFINLLPVATALGMLGLIGVPIDLGSSIVAAMAFGIVLDDSTHLLVRVQQLTRSAYDPLTAVLRAVRELIAPIMTTTLTVCAGFSILFFAEMRPFHDFATLMLTTMFAALIADVVILPVLVRRFLKDPLSVPASERSS